MKTNLKRGLMLAAAVAAFAFIGTKSASAYDHDYNHDGYYHHGYYNSYHPYYYHHHGYWGYQNGVRVWITL